jgi:predicted nucleic acid-binding Zn ribbon protein
MDDELVLYSYTCTECAHKGEVHREGDDHEDEQHICNACGAIVWLQWDGGVTFRLTYGKQTDR